MGVLAVLAAAVVGVEVFFGGCQDGVAVVFEGVTAPVVDEEVHPADEVGGYAGGGADFGLGQTVVAQEVTGQSVNAAVDGDEGCQDAVGVSER